MSKSIYIGTPAEIALQEIVDYINDHRDSELSEGERAIMTDLTTIIKGMPSPFMGDVEDDTSMPSGNREHSER
jgi:hypothetical protein